MGLDTTFVVNNYNNDTSWIQEYTDNYVIYNKGEPIDDPKAIQTPNVGYNIFDYFTYIIDNYENLPPVMAFIKSNVFPRHMTRDEFDEKIGNNTFTPLLSKTHKTDGKINYYDAEGNYYEVNSYWYINHYLPRSLDSFEELIDLIGIRGLPYLCFAPGANYIVPKENVLKHQKGFYEKLRSYVDYTQLPGEAHLLERVLYTIWK